MPYRTFLVQPKTTILWLLPCSIHAPKFKAHKDLPKQSQDTLQDTDYLRDRTDLNKLLLKKIND